MCHVYSNGEINYSKYFAQGQIGLLVRPRCKINVEAEGGKKTRHRISLVRAGNAIVTSGKKKTLTAMKRTIEDGENSGGASTSEPSDRLTQFDPSC